MYVDGYSESRYERKHAKCYRHGSDGGGIVRLFVQKCVFAKAIRSYNKAMISFNIYNNKTEEVGYDTTDPQRHNGGRL